MLKHTLAGCLFMLFVKSCTAVNAGEKKILNNEIPRITSAIEIDGDLTEAVWSKGLKISLNYEVEPGENIPALVQTEATLLEDGEFLYISFSALDPNPDKIRAYLSERDDIWNSDYVSISLDTFNDSRRAYRFSVNALGIQADSIIDEITGVTDLGWDTIWESAGRVTDSGYNVEMSIPLKSLRFEQKTDVKTWKVQVNRTWLRDVEHQFSNVKDNRNDDCSICQFEQVNGFAKVTPAKNITIIPALTFSKSDSRDIGNNRSWESGETDERGSLDLRWGINKNVFLNATVNPDFSQVEADAVQLQINKRFAIFTPEKRAFFLDGTDYFSNWSRLVHTRLFTEPEYGLKVTGKNGAHNYGLISLKDKDTNFLLSDNQSSRLVRQFGVESENQIFRYRYDAGDNGNIGLTYTNRESFDYGNEMFSIDGKYWLSRSGYFKFQALKSESTNSATIQEIYLQDDQQSGDGYSLNYTHITRDWSAIFTHHRFDKGFRADAGFVSKSDWISSAVQLEHHWYPSDQFQWWKKLSVDYLWNKVTNINDKKLNNINALEVSISGVYQSSFGFYYHTDKENFVEQSIPIESDPQLYLQEYSVESYEVFANISPIPGLDLSLVYQWGDEIDFSSADLGKIETLSPSLEYQLSDHWRFTLEYINEILRVRGSPVYDVHLVNFKAAYQLNINSSVRLTLQSQKEGLDKKLASQLLYSYKVNPFTLFYIGYSDNAFASEERNQLKRSDRTLFVKFSYAWQL